MIRSTLKYSLICSVFLIALFFVSLIFGSNPLLDFRHFFFDLAVFFLFIYFAGKEFKDFKNEGFLHFWQGISIGFIVFVPAVLLFSLTLYVIFELNPVLIEGYKEGARSLLEKGREVYLERFTMEDLQKRIADVDSITAAQLVLSTIPKKLFAAFMVTPVVSVILRKKPKQL